MLKLAADVFEKESLEVIVNGINHVSQPKFRTTTNILVWSDSPQL